MDMKVYILTLDPDKFTVPNVINNIKLKTARCIKSCENYGYDYELIYGPTTYDEAEVWFKKYPGHTSRWINRRTFCTINHAMAFERIIEDNQPALTMEFDGYLLKPIDFEIEEKKWYHITDSPHHRYAHGQIVTPYCAKIFIDFIIHDTHDAGVPVDTMMNIHQEVKHRMYDYKIELSKKFTPVINRGYVGGNEDANNKQMSARKAEHFEKIFMEGVSYG